MPEITKQPATNTAEDNGEAKDYLKAFRTHGLTDLTLVTASSKPQARCECPFCGKSKLYVSPETSKWDCKVCAPNGGNLTTFLRMVYSVSKDVGDNKFYEELCKDRKLLKASTLKIWGVRKHFLTGEVIVPGYNPQGKIVTLYRYVTEHKTGKRALYVTPATGHGLLAPSNTKGFADGPRLAEIKDVLLCEGVWDGMALWEIMRYSKPTEGADTNNGKQMQLSPTTNEDASLLKDTAVFAVPGCNVFYPQWPLVCAGKQVSLLFDNDHAKEAPVGSGRWVRTGYDGMKRVANILLNYEEPPESIQYLKWSGKLVTPGADKNPKNRLQSADGYDPKLPDGADVRDYLTSAFPISDKPSDEKARRDYLRKLLDKLTPIPDKWLAGRTSKVSKMLKGVKALGSTEIEPLECRDWKTLIDQWQKAMRWTEGLDRATSVALAVAVSTPMVGDQLWVQIISPPSTGKSVICEAMSVARKWVMPKSTIRGFLSGFDLSGKGEDDNSLISKLYGKTLVTKDGDTLLQAPNRNQILAEARDVYDRVSRTNFRNKIDKDYEGVSMTWLLCGTGSLRLLDTSELGERFLRCTIMEDIDPDLEDEILWRVVNRAERNVSQEANGVVETQYDPAMLKAMRMTGGYVNHLRENAARLLAATTMSDEAKRECIRFGKFVAYLRARPSQKQDEIAEREFAARLVSQHTRLAKCLAVVMNRKKVDKEVMRRVKRVCMDTAKGRSLDIVRYLFKLGESGAPTSSIAVITHTTEDKQRILLRFMRKIGVLETHEPRRHGIKMKVHWRLTERLRNLYKSVTGEKEPTSEDDDE